MTGPDLREIRQRLGLTAEAFGRALGYRGSRNAVQVQVAGMESGARVIPVERARLAAMYDRFGVPTDFMTMPR